VSTRSAKKAESYNQAVSLVYGTICHPHRSEFLVLIRGSIEADNIAAPKAQTLSTNSSAALRGPLKNIPVKSTKKQLYQWIQSQYDTDAFSSSGFIGWDKFRQALISKMPQQREQT
jgi:hypothetical protein